MGLIISKILEFFESFREDPVKAVMLGLDAAGKTTILYKLKLNEVVRTIPTIGFNVETVNPFKGLTLTIWDIGAQVKYRNLWKNFNKDIDGLIYVVDSNDPKRFQESKEELFWILSSDIIDLIPVLILANKQDLPQAEPVTKIVEHLGMKKLANKWHIQGCCAVNGDGLLEGMKEFSRMVKEYKKRGR